MTRLFAALGIVAATLVSAHPASAIPTTIVQSGTLSVTDTSAAGATTASMPFEQFDPALGTFLEIEFSFTRSLELTLRVSGLAEASGRASVSDASLVFGDPTVGVNFATLFGSIALSCAGPPFPCDVSRTDTQPLTPSTFTHGFFPPQPHSIGTGTWDAVVSLDVIATAVTGSASAQGTFGGPLTVTYLYEPSDPPPTAVPQPAALLLLASALPILTVWVRYALLTNGQPAP